MQHDVTIERDTRRVSIRARGQWTIAQAEAYKADMVTLLDWAMQTGQPITLFADLVGLVVHTAEVARHIEGSVELMRRLPLERYALIAPSYLMRMQCRRLLAGIDHRFFETSEEAFAWLGWNALRPAA